MGTFRISPNRQMVQNRAHNQLNIAHLLSLKTFRTLAYPQTPIGNHMYNWGLWNINANKKILLANGNLVMLKALSE